MTTLSFYCFSLDERFHENFDISARSYTPTPGVPKPGNWVKHKTGHAIKDTSENIMLYFPRPLTQPDEGIRQAVLFNSGIDWAAMPTQTEGKFQVFDTLDMPTTGNGD